MKGEYEWRQQGQNTTDDCQEVKFANTVIVAMGKLDDLRIAVVLRLLR
jgi:hypothetical protein